MICPTCQMYSREWRNRSSRYCAWGCFRYFWLDVARPKLARNGFAPVHLAALAAHGSTESGPEVPIGASAEGIASIATTAKRVAERNAHARQDRGRCARDRKLAGAIRKCSPHVARRDPEGASRRLL